MSGEISPQEAAEAVASYASGLQQVRPACRFALPEQFPPPCTHGAPFLPPSIVSPRNLRQHGVKRRS